MARQNLWNWLSLLGLGAAAVPILAAGLGKGEAQTLSSGWQLAEPVTYENLTLFPVISAQSADTSAFLTLDEGLSSGEVMVTEQGSDVLRRSRDGSVSVPQYQGASVNQLVLINHSKRPLLLLAGELVSGGKQDRIIAKDRIVAPGAPPLPLDVFCVEHGRWSFGVDFAAGKAMVHPSVREAAAIDQQQGEVWSAVVSGSRAAAAASAAAGDLPQPLLSQQAIANDLQVAAPTQAYQKIYNSPTTAAPINSFADEIQRRFAHATENLKGERVIGVVVAYGGEVAWADVFASPELFARYWPKLARSYVVEALARPQLREHATLEDAREFLKPLTGRENAETEPGVYRWSSVSQGRFAEVVLDALRPSARNLHWLKVHRTT
jgi:hypothetical protein